jgi:hypothetical protein
MTRKDFQLIADALRSVKPADWDDPSEQEANDAYVMWQDTVTSISNALATTNTQYNEQLFLAACGMED